MSRWRIAFYFKECGKHLLDYDEALETFKNQNRILERLPKKLVDIYYELDDKRCDGIQIEEKRSGSNIIEYRSAQENNNFTMPREAKQNLHWINLDREIAISWLNIGQCSRITNALDEAMKYLERSLKYFEKNSQSIDSKQNIAIALNEIGYCLKAMKKYTEALIFLNKSLKIQESFSTKIWSDGQKATTYNNIRACLMNVERFSDAMKSLDIQQKIPFVFDSDNLISVTLPKLGSCFMKTKKFSEAFLNLQKSLEYQQEISLDV